MSRSRYNPGWRYDHGDRDEWYAFKRRREDVRTGWVRVRIYGAGRWYRKKKDREEKQFFKDFFSNKPGPRYKEVRNASVQPYSPGWAD